MLIESSRGQASRTGSNAKQCIWRESRHKKTPRPDGARRLAGRKQLEGAAAAGIAWPARTAAAKPAARRAAAGLVFIFFVERALTLVREVSASRFVRPGGARSATGRVLILLEVIVGTGSLRADEPFARGSTGTGASAETVGLAGAVRTSVPVNRVAARRALGRAGG